MFETDIQRLLRSRDNWFDASVGSAFTDLFDFLSSVQSDGFQSVCHRLAGQNNHSRDTVAAIRDVAEKVVGKLSPWSGALFSKALQEALLDTAGIEYSLQADDFESRFKKFLDNASPADFIELVLVLYVFHSIWISIQDEIRRISSSEEAFDSSISAIRRLSDAAGAEAIRESIANRELDRARTDPNAGVRIMARVHDRVLNGVGA